MPPLSPKSLASEWKKGAFRSVYYFFGEDSGSKHSAIQALRKMVSADEFNSNDFPGDTDEHIQEIISTCSTPPMFSARRLVVVRNAKFSASGRKRLAEYLRSPLDSTTLVLISEERKPTAKDAVAAGVEALGGVVLFKPLSEGEAATRLKDEAKRAGITLDSDAAQLLVDEAGCEWGILRAELAKVLLFTKDKGKADAADVMSCLGYKHQTNPFDLPRSLERRDLTKTLSLLKNLLREGNNPFGLLFRVTQTLQKQLKAKRLSKSGAAQDQIFRELRLQPYYDRDYMTILAKIGEASLVRNLRDCLDTEITLKTQSWLDPSIELEQLVLKVCRKA